MLVFDAADFFEKVRKVVGLGEAGELRRVMQSDIVQGFDARREKAVKKPLRVGLRESYGRYVSVHGHAMVGAQIYQIPAMAHDRRRRGRAADRPTPADLPGW